MFAYVYRAVSQPTIDRRHVLPHPELPGEFVDAADGRTTYRGEQVSEDDPGALVRHWGLTDAHREHLQGLARESKRGIRGGFKGGLWTAKLYCQAQLTDDGYRAVEVEVRAVFTQAFQA